MESENRYDTKYRVIIALTIGILLTLLVQFFIRESDWISNIIQISYLVYLIGFLIVIVTILAIIFYKEEIFLKVFKTPKSEFSTINENLRGLVKGLHKKDLGETNTSINNLFRGIVGVVSWINFKWWIIFLLNTLFVGFLGVIGTILLYNQNELVEKQNVLVKGQNDLVRYQNLLFKSQNRLIENQLLIDSIQEQLLASQNTLFLSQNRLIEKQSEILIEQNERLRQHSYLQEASRRNAAAFLLSNIITAVNTDIEKDYLENDIRDLSPQTIASIISIANQFRPYKYFEDDKIIEKALSPERGQLLIFLHESNLDTNSYNAIYSKANFSNSDLQNTKFYNAYFSKANLEGSDFSDSELFNVNFNEASLLGAKFGEAKLVRLKLRKTKLAAVKLEGAYVTKKIGEQYYEQNRDLIEYYKKHEVEIGQSENPDFNLAMIYGVNFMLNHMYGIEQTFSSSVFEFMGEYFSVKKIVVKKKNKEFR